MMSLHLTPDELYEITGYRHGERVRTALSAMGIHFKVRPADKYTLVDRDHYKLVMSGGIKTSNRREPRWEAARG